MTKNDLDRQMFYCDYPLARNLIKFAVALDSETVVRFVRHSRRESYSFTLRDLQINQEA